jgi:hypothetical protein
MEKCRLLRAYEGKDITGPDGTILDLHRNTSGKHIKKVAIMAFLT